MKQGGNRQLLRNTLWSSFEMGLYPLLMVAATPLFINRLGAELYGIWMLVNTLVQTLNSLNFGVGDSTIRLVSRYRVTDDQAQISRTVNRNLSIAVFILLLCLALSWAAGQIPGLFGWLNVKEHQVGQVKNILLLGAASAGLKFSELVLLGLFRGYERFDIASRLSLFSRCSVVLGNMAVVFSGGSLESVFTCTVIINAVNLLVQLITVRRFFPFLRFAPVFKPAGQGGLSGFHTWYWLQSVIALLGFLSDKLLVAHFFDLQTLGYYSLGSLIAIQVHNIMLGFGTFLFPRVSYSMQAGRDTAGAFHIASAAINSFGWIVLAGLMLTGPVIFNWWLGEDTYRESIRFINLFLVFEAAIQLIIVPYHFLNGSNHVRFNSLFEIILRCSHVIAMLAGYRLGGDTGLVWGLIVSTLVNIPFQYMVFTRHVFGKADLSMSFTILIVPLLFTACIFVSTGGQLGIACLIGLGTWLLYGKGLGSLYKHLLQ